MSAQQHSEMTGPTHTVVAAVQMEPHVGDKAHNLARSMAAITEAAARGAQLVVLPELTSSGYVFASREEAVSLAETIPDGPSTRAWAEVAQRLQITIVAGVAERDGEHLYNSAVVVGPQGFIGKYRKLHLWGNEHLFFEKGNSGLPVFDSPLGRLAVAICYDCWFPEVFRTLALADADIVCVPTNWVPMPGQAGHPLAMANMLAMAAAHQNGLSLVCANRIGTERGQSFIGQSLVIGANGWPLAGPADASSEHILTATIDLQQARAARQLTRFNHVLGDRRVDVYGRTPEGGPDTS